MDVLDTRNSSKSACQVSIERTSECEVTLKWYHNINQANIVRTKFGAYSKVNDLTTTLLKFNNK